jgi:chorismate mutase
MRIRHGVLALVLAGLTITPLTGCAGDGRTPGAGGRTSAVSPAPGEGDTTELDGLVTLAVRRLATADEVASAKFGTPQPIDDPAREHQVLGAVGRRAPELGTDPTESSRFFGDQIEANKIVQRGLYQLWTAHPELRPADRPDLTKTVRPELDQLTDQLLRALSSTRSVRHAGASCVQRRDQAAATAGQSLDPLHREALAVALRSVCA